MDFRTFILYFQATKLGTSDLVNPVAFLQNMFSHIVW